MDTTTNRRFVRYNHETRDRHPFEFNGLGDVVDGVVLQMEMDAAITGYREFHEHLAEHKGFDIETGLDYAVLHGGAPERTSTDRAIMLHAALGISLDEMLPIAEFIRRLADEADLHDEQGLPLPVVVTGTPDYRFAQRLSKADRHALRSGDMGVIGRQNLRLVNRLLHRPPLAKPLEAIDIGYSQGTATAVGTTENAPDYNVHIQSLIMGATPNVIHRRGRGNLFGGFAVSAWNGQYPKGAPRVFTTTSANQAAFLGTLLRSAEFYVNDILRGLSTTSAATSVLQGWRNNGRNTQINIGGGTHDRVGLDHATLHMVRQLSTPLGSHLENLTALGADHALSRDVYALGRMVIFALGRLKTPPVNGSQPSDAVVRVPSPYV